MRISNHTVHPVDDLLNRAVETLGHADLRVEVRYCPKGSGRSASGTYYRFTKSAPDGKLIRLRINRANRYPVKISFKTSSYFERRDARGKEITYQRLQTEEVQSPEHLLLAVFLHEFSHYLDHVEGRNGNYKQTKADKFALEALERLGIVKACS